MHAVVSRVDCTRWFAPQKLHPHANYSRVDDTMHAVVCPKNLGCAEIWTVRSQK